jgi:hypothetical protein
LTIVKQEEALVDMQFFSILNRILQSTMAQGDQSSQKELMDLQQLLFDNTEEGKRIYAQAKESEAVIKALQEAGKDGLTREKLLDVILAHQSDVQVSTLVSMARSGMDYEFFKLLTDKIDQAKDEEKTKLTELRDKLLHLTEEIDKRMQEEFNHTKTVLEKILAAPNIEAAMQENIAEINEFFVQILETELSAARKSGDLERINKLEQVMIFIEKATQPNEEVKFLESLLDIEDDTQLEETLKADTEKISQEFLGLLNSVIAQADSQGAEAAMMEKLKKIYKIALRVTMQANMGK